MFFMMGVTQEKKDLEHDQTMICDVCGSFGRYNVFVVYTVLTLFFLPVWKWNRHYYVETSCCYALYELDPEIGRKIENGEDVKIKESDLLLITSKGTTYKKCAYCGYETDEDFEFCPKCGHRF